MLTVLLSIIITTQCTPKQGSLGSESRSAESWLCNLLALRPWEAHGDTEMSSSYNGNKCPACLVGCCDCWVVRPPWNAAWCRSHSRHAVITGLLFQAQHKTTHMFKIPFYPSWGLFFLMLPLEMSVHSPSVFACHLSHPSFSKLPLGSCCGITLDFGKVTSPLSFR